MQWWQGTVRGDKASSRSITNPYTSGLMWERYKVEWDEGDNDEGNSKMMNKSNQFIFIISVSIL